MDPASVALQLLALPNVLTDPDVLAPDGPLAGELRSGRMVVVHDAFRASWAEQVWKALNESRAWQPYEGSQGPFHYRHHNLYDARTFPPVLTQCRIAFDGSEARQAVQAASGRDCSGPLQFGASWYMPGDYSLPHDDSLEVPETECRRQVSFVWHLTKQWQPEWGGHLYWAATQQYFPPSFNSLYLFTIGPGQHHFVAPVSQWAQGKRLTVNGWFTGTDFYPQADPPSVQLPLEVRPSVGAR